MNGLRGIHHITAITADAQRNLEFYSGVLGLRLVKRTVNFDDPGSYHLYYGDSAGAPGTLPTFFAWPGAAAGRTGTGEIAAFTLSVPPESLAWWAKRVQVVETGERFGEPFLVTRDPDGIRIELTAHPSEGDSSVWRGGTVPVEHAITGIHSVALQSADPAAAATFYTDTLKWVRSAESDGRVRFATGSVGAVDLLAAQPAQGRMGAGTIHHVAFRTPNDSEQENWLRLLKSVHLHPSPVMDRKYFQSIYFREPGNVLFEIATDLPGMGVDENAATLGESLQLPSEYEALRPKLEKLLPKLTLPYEARL